MFVRDLKFPAPLFSRIVGVPQPILIKWLNGNSLGQALALDGERDRSGGTGHRRYTFTDIVRVFLVKRLQDDFGISTTRAVQMCNAAYGEIEAGVASTWKRIDQNANTLLWKPIGPWLAIEREGETFSISLLNDQAALADYFQPKAPYETDAPWAPLLCEIHFIVQKVDIRLSNDDVASDVDHLLKSKS